MDNDVLDAAYAVRSQRYSGAAVVFAAGSLVRGEGTAYSDLDLVVVYSALPCAYRESFTFRGLPVEAFVHDPETLEYFFVEMDRASGIPALPQMVVEGREIPDSTDLSRMLKARAAALINAGPPPLDSESERRRRYMVTDLLDDVREWRSTEELMASGSRLFEELADYHLRSIGHWSARGKAIPRALQRADPTLCTRYCRAFESLFQEGDVGQVIQLTEELLAPHGGLLFDGYRSDAPPSWRTVQT
jgi:predicted nucleotidyltransferase